MSKEHDLHCKAIVDELEKYNSGDYFLFDGNLYPIDSDDPFWSTENNSFCLDDDGFYYYHIGDNAIDERDVEPATIYDYFSDDSIYNIDYVLDSNKELEAVRIMVACGGPNIYINTWDKKVELFWWSENGSWYLHNDICNAINDYFSMYFDN